MQSNALSAANATLAVLGLDSDLDPEGSMIVDTILAALADPSSLSDLLPEGVATS